MNHCRHGKTACVLSGWCNPQELTGAEFQMLSAPMSTVPPRGNPRAKVKGINIPNVLTYVRIAAVPIVVFLLLWPEEPTMRWTAFGIFTIAALTDYLDGYLARLWSQQTTMGRMLDPVADKLIVAACLLMLCVDGTIHSWWVWAAVIILCRENSGVGPA